VSLLPRLKTVRIISSSLFGLFLDPASEVIVEAGSGLDKVVYCLRELLNNYNILNIGLQSLIELCHLDTLVLDHSGYVLREAYEIFGDGALLLRRYELELCRSRFVEVLIRFIKEDNIFFNIFQYLPDFWGILDCRAYV
jgi:hypothetical protein